MSNIIDRLKKVFEWIEERDMRVGELWLHPKQVKELEGAGDLFMDRIAQRAVREAYLESKGALHVGVLWGARVFQTEKVVENHVAALPDGWEARLLDSTACMPF